MNTGPRFRATTGTLERSDPAQLNLTDTLEGSDPTLQRVGSGSGRVQLRVMAMSKDHHTFSAQVVPTIV